jgi:hypothetical protein
MSQFAEGMSRRTAAMLAAIATIAVLATLGLTAASAVAAAALPRVSTGGADQVTFDSATLHGAVTSHASDTSYYFQFGLTNAYGSQTTIADAGAGTANVNVALPITGLQPLTVYHYRLVAVNATGAATGKDKTLLTTKIPLSLQILTSPNPVLYGGMITVQGALSGTENASREVVLQANQFPFAAGFQNVGVNPELTTATGGFSFLLPGLTQVTQFRVVTTTNPAVISPVATENVAVNVTGHLGRARRRHFVRVFGAVTPAENGMKVAILRIAHGHGVLVGGTVLVHATATSSRFSRAVPVKSGVYRVLVQVTNGAQVSNYSQPLLIR